MIQPKHQSCVDLIRPRRPLTLVSAVLRWYVSAVELRRFWVCTSPDQTLERSRRDSLWPLSKCFFFVYVFFFFVVVKGFWWWFSLISWTKHIKGTNLSKIHTSRFSIIWVYIFPETRKVYAVIVKKLFAMPQMAMMPRWASSFFCRKLHRGLFHTCVYINI